MKGRWHRASRLIPIVILAVLLGCRGESEDEGAAKKPARESARSEVVGQEGSPSEGGPERERESSAPALEEVAPRAAASRPALPGPIRFQTIFRLFLDSF